MSYKCEILADSISPQGHRITTYKVTYPRMIHAEMLRHRMLSRNVASSRAIPFAKMVKDVEENPFIPIAWQKDHKGMQGTEYLTGEDDTIARNRWKYNAKEAVEMAKFMHGVGVTKQLCNRLLEPFVWTTEIITGTEWDNFFELRCPKYVVNWYSSQKNKTEIFLSRKEVINHVEENNLKNGWENCRNWDDNQWVQINNSQAEIHIQKIAEMMWDSYNESVPKELKAGEWHLPYGDNFDWDEVLKIITGDKATDSMLAIKIATARAARISYTTFGDDPKIDHEADIKLHAKLLEQRHMSPFEHCARVMHESEYYSYIKDKYPTIMEENGTLVNTEVYPEQTTLNINYGWCRNFRGFIPYRYLLET